MKLKKIIQYAIFLFIILNFFAYFLIYIKTGTHVYKENYLEKKKSFLLLEPVKHYVHPFFGFVDLNNKEIKKNSISNEKLFYNIYESKNKNYDQTIKILLLGGSTAINFSDNTIQAYNLKKNLNKPKSTNILAKKISNYFPNTKIIFYNAAIRSSKQPQQLFKLYYLSLIGMDFDIVINFDGPFEMAQPYVKNVPIKDELIYPRRYSDMIAAMTSDISCIDKNNEESISNSFIPILELISYYEIRNCHRKISTREGYKVNWKKFTEVKKSNLDEIAKTSHEIWRNSSIEIENFSKIKNFLYLHVIAPSQHVADSKKFSEREKQEYLDYEYGPILSKYYNKLINFKDLRIQNSLDLKYIFKNERTTVYRDGCCRLNDFGLNIVADEISKYLKNNFKFK